MSPSRCWATLEAPRRPRAGFILACRKATHPCPQAVAACNRIVTFGPKPRFVPRSHQNGLLIPQCRHQTLCVAEGPVMSWIRERDELIAQTLAFVQSVTDKREDQAERCSAASHQIRERACRRGTRAGERGTVQCHSPKCRSDRRRCGGRHANSDHRGQHRASSSGHAADLANRDGQRDPHTRGKFPRTSGAFQPRARGIFCVDHCAAARRHQGRAAAAPAEVAAIRSRTGNRYFRNSPGFSLIGKCPRPFMMVASQPGMRVATPSVSSGVQE